VRFTRSSTSVPFLINQNQDDQALRVHEVEALRVEYRRLVGRINFRTRRGWMFLSLLVLTIIACLAVAMLVLSPSDWRSSQQSRFTQMTTLVLLVGISVSLGAYFARRFDRQRERVRLARTRQQEVLARLAQLDELGVTGRRRRRRRTRRSWAWRVAHPSPFSRPPLESMVTADLEETADQLGGQLQEERAWRALSYLHAWLTGGIAAVFAFVVTLAGPQYLSDFLGGRQWGGGGGPDPLMFWLTLTLVLVVLGGLGTHRVTVLMRRARAYHDRLSAVERALWDARALLRERRQEV
jgi:hypothetical protein